MTLDIALYQLRTFREVARLGSLTKAARSLGYAQSSVTSHIRLLESRVGMPLVQRLPHGVRLTPSGVIFHEYAKRIFSVVDEMATALNPPGEPEGRATVGASALLLETRVGSLIKESRYRYPRVQISPRQLSIVSAAKAVRDGDLDLALVHGDFIGTEADPPGVVVERLPDLEVFAVGSFALAEAVDRRAALAAVKVLAVDPDCASHQLLVTALREIHGIEPQVIEAGSMGGARELARAGYGIAMLPAESVGTESEATGLTVLPGLPRVRLGVRAMWLGREMAVAAVSAVRDVAIRVGRDREPQIA